MNQFVIDITANHSGLLSGYPLSSDSRLPSGGGGRAGPVRSAWPFLVNASSQGDKQALKQEGASPSGFVS